MQGKGAPSCPAIDADIVLLDPTVKWTMGQANSHSPNDCTHEGRAITGKIASLSRGQLIVDGNAPGGAQLQALPQARPAAMSGAPRPECSMQINRDRFRPI
ncbi:MAG: hypothetical protein R2851_08535 [Caldilineaceae bacterium]